MLILGAGMSGMLAGQYFRSLQPIIWEKSSSLPNNHKALLRFRSEAVSTLTGIPFKEVDVHKAYNYKGSSTGKSDIFLNNCYSHKVIGQYSNRSVMNLKPCKRFIAPENFINMLSKGLFIQYEAEVNELNDLVFSDNRPIVSTIPVQSLANILGYNLDVELKYIPIYTMNAKIEADCDLYQTVYYPNKDLSMYRMSITGNKVITEHIREEYDYKKRFTPEQFIEHFLELDFGVNSSVKELEVSVQKYGKLIPVNGDEIRDFIRWATINFNIYSLGRWGTHRQLLMDDVVKDIKVIDKLIRTKGYSR